MEQVANSNLRQEMLSVLEFKQQTGKFPESLDDLPNSPAKADPFTNQPLKYKKTDNGFLLYSVSNNRLDDGGSKANLPINGTDWPEDLVISYPQ